MTILKCKMCGGDIELSEDRTLGTCDSCGSTMTFPKVDNEQRANMFNRGNHFRRTGEFDRALAVYEHIVQENENDAEAHWCCALCRFGIEYVEDPATFEYLPTCHRASFDSFLDDADYLAAVEHSDGVTRRQYQKDAAKIAEVQRSILATSQNEEPFDVFICYKESENDGTRTKDSLMAQDIYYQLTEQGRRVFFSRITLEDKAGTEYEPYIFAALNSAKVMLVIATSAEHVNSAWVKNEWNRFLSLMRNDRSKLLLPCYRDMDPYDLPEALSVLQSYDMSKIGFIQDLIRGVNKVLDSDKTNKTVKETAIALKPDSSTAPLLKRVFMFLEDGDWHSADAYCEKVLDIDPENAEAYLGKLMAELKVNSRDSLKDQPEPFDHYKVFQKAVRFGDDDLKTELSDYIASIKYNKATASMNAAKTVAEFESASADFKSISGIKDSDTLAEQCLKKAEDIKGMAESVYAALKTGPGNNNSPTLEDKLAESNTSIDRLTELFNGFDELQTQNKQLQEERISVESKEAELSEQRAKLGIFAGKEKKRIDEELECLSLKKKDIAKQTVQLKQKLLGYTAKSEIEHDLDNARATAHDIKEQINAEQTGKERKYSYDEALRIYVSDSGIAETVNSVYPGAPYLSIMHGKENTCIFGRYIQKKGGSPEPIEWQVLARENGRILLISKYALDCRQYNSTSDGVTWETCSLRKWLNETFLNNSFSQDEQKLIMDATVTADKNPKYSTSPGSNTKDKVFLLSIDEANRFFFSDSSRICQGTDYCYLQGAYGKYADTRYHRSFGWWLRSPGAKSNTAAIVYSGGFSELLGSIRFDGSIVVNFAMALAVRPALWINLEP